MTFALTIAFAAAAMQPMTEAECAAAMSQMEMNACAQQAFERADAELNALYRRLIDGAREDDGSPDNGRSDGDDRPGAEATLREAQRAWVAFRDAHCRGEGYAERGGSMEPMIFHQCLERLTRERIAQLTPQPSPER
jgi:uncharacterized protein YecT (DUF1311 family)